MVNRYPFQLGPEVLLHARDEVANVLLHVHPFGVLR
jgi:hypothetical protein